MEVKAAEEGEGLDVAARCSKERGVIVVANAMHSSTTQKISARLLQEVIFRSFFPCSTHTAVDNLIPTYHSIPVLSVDPVCLGSLITGVCLAFSPGSVVSVLSETLVVVAVNADVREPRQCG